jgi:hypothetical protein
MAFFGRHRPVLVAALTAALCAGGGLVVVQTAEAQKIRKADRPTQRSGRAVSRRDRRRIETLRSRPGGAQHHRPRAAVRTTNRQLPSVIGRRTSGSAGHRTSRRTTPPRERTLGLRGESRGPGRTATERRRHLRFGR